ncbi:MULTISPECIES: tyrosine-type DNA invertase [unclassified Photorhabdus]|uniref:tyrosine-type DNA invertase n=1 Tax=unclassified Photorhabdus TaxID=2620880 RepID=UPI000DCEA931|nr:MULTISPECIES: tyrosine-type DNA invertase [unclassified Photorhabdus]RAX00328.1 DNA recombinase [Photorhabdus sp. S9-53]RAX00521.1 DNA recombinase [Photorhabdus sp. S10-54]RAX04829.1 DNA recombinase [Photorhabdus sp. S8-52]
MKKRKFLTRYEINAILEKARQGYHAERDYCMLLMCFIHGFRVSELCNLTLSDLDLNSEIIHVRRLKGGLSTTHPLIPEEIKALNQWLNIRKSWRESDTEWVFLSQKSGAISRQQVYGLLKRYGKQALVNISPHPHMLRHSCGYALADLGRDTRLIQDYLGHRNISHTVIYTASNVKRFFKIWEAPAKGLD